jgi:indole-3-glycerol phosphate synthase
MTEPATILDRIVADILKEESGRFSSYDHQSINFGGTTGGKNPGSRPEIDNTLAGHSTAAQAKAHAHAQAHAARPAPLDMTEAFRKSFGIIAEVKRASPSKGLLRDPFDPVAIAKAYQTNGAQAISVITEKHHFMGSPEYLRAIRTAVGLPLLRKDFIIHPCQVQDAHDLGADCILLIAAILTTTQLQLLMSQARALGMSVLVEVHNAGEIEAIRPLCPDMVGINNRDLHDFTVDWQRCLRLKTLLPADCIAIAESGIDSAAKLRVLREHGFAGALIGESLVTQADPGKALRGLVDDQA